MKTWLPIVVAAALAFILGLVLGLRGCSEDVVKRDAELQHEVERQKVLYREAEQRRFEATAARRAAEQKVEALQAETQELTTRLMKQPRPKVYREAVQQLDTCMDVVMRKDQQMDLVREAVRAYATELEAADDQIIALGTALGASEERADMWKKRASKSRRQKIAIGIGSALGGVGLTLGAVAAAGRLQ